MQVKPNIIKYVVVNGKEFIHYDNSKEKLYLGYLTKQLHIDANIRQWVESLTDGALKFEKMVERE